MNAAFFKSVFIVSIRIGVIQQDSKHIKSIEAKRTDYFNNYVLLDFEGDKYYAIEAYDKVLRLAFGDYMQLPPIEQRVPLHDCQRFFWVKAFPKEY